VKDFLVSLRTMAWRTAGARYNASRRLKRREWFSTFSLASLSALSIAVAFAQRIYSPQAGTPLDNYLTAMSVSLGVFLLAISLLEWGAAYGAKADALHRNAEALTAYQLKLAQSLAQIAAGKAISDEQVDQLRLEYETIKDGCAHNHEPADHRLFMAEHRSAPEFAGANGQPSMEAAAVWWTRATWHASTVWFFALIWLVVAGALACAWWVPKF
jgi:hypothetical protein